MPIKSCNNHWGVRLSASSPRPIRPRFGVLRNSAHEYPRRNPPPQASWCAPIAVITTVAAAHRRKTSAASKQSPASKPRSSMALSPTALPSSMRTIRKLNSFSSKPRRRPVLSHRSRQFAAPLCVAIIGRGCRAVCFTAFSRDRRAPARRSLCRHWPNGALTMCRRDRPKSLPPATLSAAVVSRIYLGSKSQHMAGRETERQRQMVVAPGGVSLV